ncbi:hypothetical protein QJ856_gp0807 [Tupanvirus deep ocean]|uniref:Uncharacterized protein n=2 Tax=Tupanvirus TaxID=2094720 RepID=A0AC62A845_9VIRU|nr:hypothetical protein QJ856_gp0807 [Tupanvirus deep ocean]QKU33946.1 hypothetical protein [Tupanvirus deep ocean]
MKLLYYILIIIILLIVVFFLLMFITDTNKYDEPIYDFNQIKRNFKTGDIILFSCNKHSSLLDRAAYYCRTEFLGSPYGHCGIILRDGKNLYLVECTTAEHTSYEKAMHLNNYNKGGVRIIDLETMIQDYYNENGGFFGVKYIKEEIPNQIFFDNLMKYKESIFENKFLLFLFAIVDVIVSNSAAKKFINLYYGPEDQDHSKRMMCCEFIYRMLKDCGAVMDYQAKLFWPYLFTNGKFDELSIMKFSKPVRFTSIKYHQQENYY